MPCTSHSKVTYFFFAGMRVADAGSRLLLILLLPGCGRKQAKLTLICVSHRESFSFSVCVCACVCLRERDELMTVLCTLRASQAEAQQREWSSYQQVKQAVAMAEEANLEKTQASTHELFQLY